MLRLVLFLLGVLISLPGPAFSQRDRVDLQCNATANPPTVRAEGLSELLGDVVLNCLGGSPTPAGQPVPPFDVRIFLNTNFTSRLLDNASLSEALLVIDNPNSANQALCAGGVCPVNGVGGDGLLYHMPSAMSNRGEPVRNVFQGRQSGANSVVWLGVPIDPPGTIGTRIIRITNVRANANALAGANTFSTNPIMGMVSVSAASTGVSIPINNPNQILAYVGKGLEYKVENAQAYRLCEDVNRNFAMGSPPAGGAPPQSSGIIGFTETYPNVFRPRIGMGTDALGNPFPPPVDQNVPGQANQSESGFFNRAFPGNPGLADHGTRLSAVFGRIPSDMSIYVGTVQSPRSSPGVQARLLEDCEKPAQAAAPVSGYSVTRIPVMDGFAKACWEVTRANSREREDLYFDYFVGRMGTTAGDPVLTFAEVGLMPAVPISQNRKESNKASTTPNFDRGSADPLRSTQDLFLAFNFISCASNAPDQLQGVRPPAFADGTIVTSNSSGPQNLNIFLYSTRTQRPVMVSPVVSSTPPQAREATVGWLTVTQSQGVTPMTVTIQANPAGLSPGTYQGGVRFDFTGGALQLPVALNVLPPGPRFSAPGVVGAADYFSGAVAPGQAVVIFGEGYGPDQLAPLTVDAQGRLATALAETRILFDGLPAPMIYSVKGQASAFVPFGVASRPVTEVRVEYRGVRSPAVFLPVLEALPGIFTASGLGFGQGAILNQDGSFNSRSNPAAPGEIIVIFGSGAGQTNPPGVDGRLAGLPLPVLEQRLEAFIDGRPSEVIYAGPAPGLAEGVLQVNARIPPDTRGGRDVEISFLVGPFRTQPGVTVAVR